MFKTLANALKIKEIRNGILFTLFIIIIIRFGSLIPAPFIDQAKVNAFFKRDEFNLINAFTGGSFTQMTLFALGVTPYITSSIIMQLLTIAIPALEEMQKDGDDGRKKMAAITRVVSILLAVIESIGLTIGFNREGFITKTGFAPVSVIIITLTAGSALVMWLGERISEKGVGNGISIVLLANIVARMPIDFKNLYDMFVKGKDVVHMIYSIAIIAAVIILTTVLVIILQDAERRIPVSYAQKIQGRRMVGGKSSYIPLKVNTGGVMPIIFASTLISVPTIMLNLFNVKVKSTFWSKVLHGLQQDNWFKPGYGYAYIGLVIYVLLVIFFAYFYTSITFNPMEVSNNLKKSGGFIPGIRPGKPTQEYLNRVLNYIVIIGVIGLIIIAIIPIFFSGRFSADVSFGGTSLIIIVGVIIETIKQIESKMVVRNYNGFLND